MRYRLRTLLIAMALGPPILAVAWAILGGEEANPVLVGAIMYVAVVATVCWLYGGNT